MYFFVPVFFWGKFLEFQEPVPVVLRGNMGPSGFLGPLILVVNGILN